MSEFVCRSATEAGAWDEFVRAATSPNEFLESWKWGDFQAATGKSIERLEVVRGQERVAVSLMVPHTTRLRRDFWLSPRGPIIRPELSPDDQLRAWQVLLEATKQAHGRSSMFLKVEPNIAPPSALPLEVGTGIHPEQTLLIDVSLSDDELMRGMHPKTRYNIGLARRDHVTIQWSREPAALEAFLELLQKTAAHQGIGIFPHDYYRTMVKTFGTATEIGLAERGGQAIACALMIRFGNVTTYLHGGSSYEERSHMAPYLLHWEAIQRARSQGSVWYDFYGIAPAGVTDHKWSGITRFKLGFGGTVKHYPGAFNLVYQRPWYLAYRLAKRVTGQ